MAQFMRRVLAAGCLLLALWSSPALAVLALDGTATGSSNSTATSLVLGGLTTTNAGDVICVAAMTDNSAFSGARTLTGVSGTGTTGWAARKTLTGNTGSFHNLAFELWCGTASGTLSAVALTLDYSGSGSFTAAAAFAFGISGANTASPFDPANSSTATDLSGSTSVPSTTITTTNANDILIAVLGTGESGPTFGDVQSTFTAITSINGFGGPNFNAIGAEGEYKVVSATQSGASVGFTGSHGNWFLIVDAIKQAGGGASVIPGTVHAPTMGVW